MEQYKLEPAKAKAFITEIIKNKKEQISKLRNNINNRKRSKGKVRDLNKKRELYRSKLNEIRKFRVDKKFINRLKSNKKFGFSKRNLRLNTSKLTPDEQKLYNSIKKENNKLILQRKNQRIANKKSQKKKTIKRQRKVNKK